MRTPAISLAVLLALAPAAAAQEGSPPPGEAPPAPAAAPAKHENRISEAAKKAIETMARLTGNPVLRGLEELSGTVTMKMVMDSGGVESDMGMGMSFEVALKRPDTFTIGMKGAEMFGPQADQMKEGLKYILLTGMGFWSPTGDEEFDADLVTEEGKKVLVITTYLKGKPGPVMRLGLAENGLPDVLSMDIETSAGPGGPPVKQRTKMAWSFTKDDELFRMEKCVMEVPGLPGPIEYRVRHTDVGGFSLPTHIVLDLGGTGMGPMKQVYRYTKLTVNGKEVDLPKEEKATMKIPTLPGRKPAAGEPGGKPGEGEETDGGGK